MLKELKKCGRNQV